MKMRLVFLILGATFLFVTCTQYREIQPTRTRNMQPSEVAAYHPPITLNIGWVPYQDQKLVKTGKNEWKIVKTEAGKQGAVPFILVNYADSKDTIFLDMNMDNAMLGKLIKHSLMTQEPIRRPFTEFFEVASCQRCHPAEVKVDFDK